MHRYRSPRAAGGGFCEGRVQGVYVRKGAGSGRWIKLGEMCLRCHTFWAADPEVTAETLVERELERLGSA